MMHTEVMYVQYSRTYTVGPYIHWVKLSRRVVSSYITYRLPTASSTPLPRPRHNQRATLTQTIYITPTHPTPPKIIPGTFRQSPYPHSHTGATFILSYQHRYTPRRYPDLRR